MVFKVTEHDLRLDLHLIADWDISLLEIKLPDDLASPAGIFNYGPKNGNEGW